MNNEVGNLLKDAANIFAQLACAFEDEHERLTDRLAYLENKTEQNKSTLKAIAETILEKLD